MTTDLYILPFEGFEDNQYSNSVLRLCGFDATDILSELYKVLSELTDKAKENNQFVPERFLSHLGRDHNGNHCYGEAKYPLPYVFVKDLLELEELHKEYYKEDDNPDPFYIQKERALGTMTYLKTLPKNRRIALYWDE